MKHFTIATIILISTTSTAVSANVVHLANGVKIGEVTSTSGIIWVRLTAQAEYKSDGPEFQQPQLVETPDGNKVDAAIAAPENGYCHQIPQGLRLQEMQTVVPGTRGQVRLRYWPADAESAKSVTFDWTAVDAARDFTHQFQLSSLRPGTRYAFVVEGRAAASADVTASVPSSFKTAPARDDASANVTFTVVTGQKWQTRDDPRGQKIYPIMSGLEPSFFVHTGDIVYYDQLNPWATHIDLARFKWNRTYSQPSLRDFHNRVPSYFIKDDHDSWQNDCWPTQANNRMGQFTWEQGRRVFLEQVPMGDRTYRTIRWGKHLQVWLVEGRDFRSPNDAPDGRDKTIWGEEQNQWFRRTVTQSDATFRVLISPTPVLGPDHLWKEGKSDNHVATTRSWEGARLRQLISSQKNMFVVCGDRHWQYVSADPERGLREYSCGPTTDRHSTTLKNDDHRLLKYLGERGGFLAVTVSTKNGTPTIVFRHYDVSGNVVNEDTPALGS